MWLVRNRRQVRPRDDGPSATPVRSGAGVGRIRAAFCGLLRIACAWPNQRGFNRRRSSTQRRLMKIKNSSHRLAIVMAPSSGAQLPAPTPRTGIGRSAGPGVDLLPAVFVTSFSAIFCPTATPRFCLGMSCKPSAQSPVPVPVSGPWRLFVDVPGGRGHDRIRRPTDRYYWERCGRPRLVLPR